MDQSNRYQAPSLENINLDRKLFLYFFLSAKNALSNDKLLIWRQN